MRLTIRQKLFLTTVIPFALIYNFLFVTLQVQDFKDQQAYLAQNLRATTTMVARQLNTLFDRSLQLGESISLQLQVMSSMTDDPYAIADNTLKSLQPLPIRTSIFFQQEDLSLQRVITTGQEDAWRTVPDDFYRELQQWLQDGISRGVHESIFAKPLVTTSGDGSGFFHATYTPVGNRHGAILTFIPANDFIQGQSILMNMDAFLFLLNGSGRRLFPLNSDSKRFSSDIINRMFAQAESCSRMEQAHCMGKMFDIETFLHFQLPIKDDGLILSAVLSTTRMPGLLADRLPHLIIFLAVQLLAFLMIWVLTGHITKAFSAICQAMDNIATEEKDNWSSVTENHNTQYMDKHFSRMSQRISQREQKQQESLSTSFDRLLGALNQGIYYFAQDDQGYLRHLSPWMREALSMTGDITKYHYSWLHSGSTDSRRASEVIDSVLNGAEMGTYEIETTSHNGDRCHFEIVIIPAYDAHGSVIGVKGVARNITRWVTDVGHFKGLLQYAPDAIIIANDQGVVELVNSRAEALFGYQGNQLLGQRLCSFIADEYRDKICVGQQLPEALTSPSGVEINITSRSGELIPVELTMNAIATPDGQHFSLFMRDISKRRAAEQALHASEERYRRTIDALQKEYIFYSQNTDGSFISVTPSVMPILGYSQEYFMKNWRKTINRSKDITLISQVLRKLCAGETHPSYQLEVMKADGTIATLEIYESAAFNDQGEVVAIEGIAHDCTRQRRASLALAEARDKAQAANDAKTQFLSSMSHELRTPLNGILGYAQLLQTDANMTHDQLDQLRGIQTSGQHLLTLINDILDLSRAESGHLSIVVRPFSLQELVDSIRQMVCQQAEAKRLSFRITVRQNVPPFILGDQTKIRQVIINLLSNAINFTDAGIVHLDISCDNQQLLFTVQDTGVGIAPEQIKSIFSPFQQGAAGVKKGGTGLGLAISKRIADAMHGSLEVTSEPNVGSRFVFAIAMVCAFTSDKVSDLPTELGMSDADSGMANQAANSDFTVIPHLPHTMTTGLGQQLSACIDIGDIESIRHTIVHLRNHELTQSSAVRRWLDKVIRYCDALDIDSLSQIATALLQYSAEHSDGTELNKVV